MLICVSANPAIDRRLTVEKLSVGSVNRAASALPLPGGKAAHVAMAARSLGEQAIWIGFLGGPTGEACEKGLTALGIRVAAVKTASETRTNLEIIESNGTVTEVLEPGAHVTERDVERMFSLCRDLFSELMAGTQVVLSGSLPSGAPPDFYARLIRLAQAYECRTLLDTSGDALRAALIASPDLVKPNREEVAAITGLHVHDFESAVSAARALFEEGARSVAISLGADGMFWQESPDAAPLLAHPPRVAVRSTVGCGDASVAGFAVAHDRGLSGEEALRLSVACGTANCLADTPGMIAPAEVERIKNLAEVSENT